MRLGGIAADVHRALAVLHVVVRIGHRTVAPGIGYAGDRRRVTDARLVIAVVGTPERHELAQQKRLLVAVLGAADPEYRVLTAFILVVADREQPIAYFLDRVVPRHLLPLAVDQLHRRLQPVRVLVHAMLAHRRALGAVRAEVERRVEHRLLPYPHAVLDHRVDRAADRAVGAHRALDFDLAGSFAGGVGLADHAIRKLTGERSGPGDETRTLQKRPPIHRGKLGSRVTAKTWTSCRGALSRASICSREQHDPFLLLANRSEKRRRPPGLRIWLRFSSFGNSASHGRSHGNPGRHPHWAPARSSAPRR